MTTAELSQNLSELESKSPEELLAWAYERHGARAALMTSFQRTGCVMIHMAHRVAPDLRVITVDTLRLHPETYALIDEIEARYGIHIERFTPDPGRLERMIDAHGEYLFFDSRGKQELCCQVRKVGPHREALDTVDVWITGLRWDQSAFRKKVPKASVIEHEGRPIIKLCPLIDWSEDDVLTYIREHNVPDNKLYSMGYESIGCVICSTPIRPGEDKRAGRWRWFNHMGDDHSKECGIHSDGSGI